MENDELDEIIDSHGMGDLVMALIDLGSFIYDVREARDCGYWQEGTQPGEKLYLAARTAVADFFNLDDDDNLWWAV